MRGNEACRSAGDKIREELPYHIRTEGKADRNDTEVTNLRVVKSDWRQDGD